MVEKFRLYLSASLWVGDWAVLDVMSPRVTDAHWCGPLIAPPAVVVPAAVGPLGALGRGQHISLIPFVGGMTPAESMFFDAQLDGLTYC